MYLNRVEPGLLGGGASCVLEDTLSTAIMLLVYHSSIPKETVLVFFWGHSETTAASSQPVQHESTTAFLLINLETFIKRIKNLTAR